ncbi:MAG: ribonucleoside-diphosphate reductase, adenosylcobalamin-dependent [Candidatus Chisholmbacteria bacterium RIFCSPLOWO2_01_FULL_49_14]|uniref:Vitamin B12-dependent ribonucleotide reductase n=1 Tax=Candidatus Chisholmbacteria bacterium RIFCSPLOWO2_01_FULL_49_14 TaxID=1797593 RepID=A0A1G1W0M7_9BACT|nr:MAG: ribonucleoside-diphosphate reductase, adenosylcobalamin-dependent [Candidatus Chisholmbacteria bacterium RIFCSPLOWO2_01_FULL_49_14]
MTRLSDNAVTILRKRDYLKRDAAGKSVETPDQMFQRVANAIASASGTYGEDVAGDARDFHRMMTRFEFLPNSPTLMHAGRNGVNQLAACFVLPIEDNLEGIFGTLHDAALVLRTGGGVGFSFSRLRPRGSLISTTGGVASGPVSYMDLFDHMAQVINEGSSRRVAMMGILRVDHPDIEEFIVAKAEGKRLTNFNVSVGITDRFMEALKKKTTYGLIDPHSGRTVRRVLASTIFNLIAEYAWKVADPGLVFLDRMNTACPIRHLGEIEATNPCGEQPLLPYQSCNLGSINLAQFVRVQARNDDWKKSINWDRLERVVRLAVKFLDNVVDVCDYPLSQIDEMSKKTRKIGLGVMGFADFLFRLGIAYDSNRALTCGRTLARFIERVAREESIELGKSRGSFPAFAGSRWEKGYPAMRNSTLTTIAPTGTISILASCSSGIEPIFALSFTRRNILDIGKTELVEYNDEFSRQLRLRIRNRKRYQAILQEVARLGTCQTLDEVPKDLKRIFVTSHDISWEWHVRMQAVWQGSVDSAVSKTINLPSSATVADVAQAYREAYETGCMGITIYRDHSRSQQVLNLGQPVSAEGNVRLAEPLIQDSSLKIFPNGEGNGNGHTKDQNAQMVVSNGDEGLCPECHSILVFQDGCSSCPNCSYSYCSVG